MDVRSRMELLKPFSGPMPAAKKKPRASGLKRVRAQPIWMDAARSKTVVPVSGAMIGIGLGPTDGCAGAKGIARRDSPRRVQTDAYHRPRVLNYVPYRITSFFQFPAKRLIYKYHTAQAFVNRAARAFFIFNYSTRVQDIGKGKFRPPAHLAGANSDRDNRPGNR